MACGSANRNNGEKAIDISNFETSVPPSEDFYRYVTGGWQKKNPLKPEFARYGAFDRLREDNELRIKELFASMSESKAEKGSIAQKIGDLYSMGLDSAKLNADGAAPIKADMAAVQAIGSPEQLAAAVASMHRTTASPLFTLFVDADMMNSAVNIAYLHQDGIGMGDRDYYLDAENENIRQAYKEYIARLFTLAGYTGEQAAAAVDAVMRIETAIAEASYTNVELRDPYANYHNLSIGELKKRYDAFDWDAYLAGMGLSQLAQINVCQLTTMDAVNKVVKETSDGDMKYYLVFNLLNSAAPYLSDDFSSARWEFYGKTLSGQQQQRPRWKRALGVPNSILSEAVGEMYVQKYFPASSKEKMVRLVGNLQEALGQHITSLEWMSEQTKAKALEKLAAFHVKIGYPDKWKDYSSLEIDPSLSYWENIKRATEWQSEDDLSQVGKPVDKDKWHMSPQTVNAYYNPTTNEICFPAAILQPPFFNPEADDAVNYGAIGVVIGHEMTYGFDDQGRQFDKDGNLADWWTEQDAEAFSAKTGVLAGQFDKIEVLDGLHANGQLTLGENIADQGGLRVAYTAMKNAQNGVEPAPIDGFTADQRFYLSYATIWAQNIRDEEIARLTKIDPHSLGEWRVNATLRNIDTFYEAFGITDGAMFMPEAERVVIW